MRRFTLYAVALALVGVAALATPAHASTTIRGTFSGEEVLPQTAEHLRLAVNVQKSAAALYTRAQRIGQAAAIRAARALYADSEQQIRSLRTTLRTATTRVSVYGDAGTRVTRESILNFLRSGSNWRVHELHVWQRDGRLQWGQRAPRGFDDRRSKPRPAPVQVRPQPRKPTSTAPFGLPTKPAPRPGHIASPTREQLERLWKPGRNQPRVTGGLYGLP